MPGRLTPTGREVPVAGAVSGEEDASKLFFDGFDFSFIRYRCRCLDRRAWEEKVSEI